MPFLHKNNENLKESLLRICILYCLHDVTYRNSCSEVFYKKVEKEFESVSLNRQVNTCLREFFRKLPFLGLGLELYLKNISIESIFKWILWNFQRQLCNRWLVNNYSVPLLRRLIIFRFKCIMDRKCQRLTFLRCFIY